MKIDRFTKDLADRLDRLDRNGDGKGRGNGSGKVHNDGNSIIDEQDDEYYLVIGSVPPRFLYYRYVRYL